MNTQPATPYLLIDGEIAARNIARLAEYGRQHEIAIRPHTKTHKSARVAELQVAAGSPGLTVAKAGEARVMSRASDDILVAYPALDRPRLDALATLSAHKTIRVAVDSLVAANQLAEAARRHAVSFGILVDLDVGLHRTGLQSSDAALHLAQHIDRAAGVRLDGLFIYPGHIWLPADEQEEALRAVSDLVARTLDSWAEHGIEANIVSAGSTPTAYQSHLIEDVTEIRPGTYVYNDRNCVEGGYCGWDDCAARVIATVVSDAVPGQVVIDAGSKTLATDLCKPAPESGHGYVVDYPQAVITKLSEEHGQVDVSRCDTRPQLGDQVAIIPNHICVCVNLQNEVWWQQGNNPPEPLPVDARGLLS